MHSPDGGIPALPMRKIDSHSCNVAATWCSLGINIRNAFRTERSHFPTGRVPTLLLQNVACLLDVAIRGSDGAAQLMTHVWNEARKHVSEKCPPATALQRREFMLFGETYVGKRHCRD